MTTPSVVRPLVYPILGKMSFRLPRLVVLAALGFSSLVLALPDSFLAALRSGLDCARLDELCRGLERFGSASPPGPGSRLAAGNLYRLGRAAALLDQGLLVLRIESGTDGPLVGAARVSAGEALAADIRRDPRGQAVRSAVLARLPDSLLAPAVLLDGALVFSMHDTERPGQVRLREDGPNLLLLNLTAGDRPAVEFAILTIVEDR